MARDQTFHNNYSYWAYLSKQNDKPKTTLLASYRNYIQWLSEQPGAPKFSASELLYQLFNMNHFFADKNNNTSYLTQYEESYLEYFDGFIADCHSLIKQKFDDAQSSAFISRDTAKYISYFVGTITAISSALVTGAILVGLFAGLLCALLTAVILTGVNSYVINRAVEQTLESDSEDIIIKLKQDVYPQRPENMLTNIGKATTEALFTHQYIASVKANSNKVVDASVDLDTLKNKLANIKNV